MIWKYKGGEFDLRERGIIMGILNITPDSFSDGGKYSEVDKAVNQALSMVAQGAKIIDIGGESTRPGSPAVSVEIELSRTIPVILKLREQWNGVISIDTSKPDVAREAIEAGANIVNDVTGLIDPEMVFVCRDNGVGVVAMHMQGNPRTMQQNPNYLNVVDEVSEFLEKRYETLTVAGIKPEYLCFDPGIGFGKSVEHNLEILRNLPRLIIQDRPLLVGLSRKSFISKLLGEESLENRTFPTIALTSYCRRQGVMIHRVHEVRDNDDALRMVEAIEAF